MMGIILYKLYVFATFQSLVVSSPPSSVTIGMYVCIYVNNVNYFHRKINQE